MAHANLNATVVLTSLALLGGACQARQGTERSRHPDTLELRVMSFNIRYGLARDGANRWDNRRDMVLDVVRAHQPDVIGTQEALRFQIDYIRTTLPEYGEIGVGRDDGAAAGEYAAILYRLAVFDVAEQGTFWFSDTPHAAGSKSWGNRIPRICTWARLVDRASQRDFYVYNVHLDHESQPSRERSVDLLMKRIGQRAHNAPVVVTGDFNADEDNPAIRRIRASSIARTAGAVGRQNARLVDTFRVLHPDTNDVQTFNGFGTTPDRGKIDYVFAAESVEVLDARIIRDQRDGRFPSDHFPVVARLRFSQTVF